MITILPKINGDEIIFEARDGDRAVGEICACISESVVTVRSLSGEKSLEDGLCRALFSYALRRGVSTAVFSSGVSENLARLSYKEQMELNSFFVHKNCENSL